MQNGLADFPTTLPALVGLVLFFVTWLVQLRRTEARAKAIHSQSVESGGRPDWEFTSEEHLTNALTIDADRVALIAVGAPTAAAVVAVAQRDLPPSWVLLLAALFVLILFSIYVTTERISGKRNRIRGAWTKVMFMSVGFQLILVGVGLLVDLGILR